MTEAAVSFAGNLTDQPEVRYTEGGIARAMFRVAVSGRREQEGVVLHCDRVARPGRACGGVPLEGGAGSWSWAGFSSGAGRLRMAAPGRRSR
jgi:hypothetical protein